MSDENREYVRIADAALEELGRAYQLLRGSRYPDQRQADVTFAVARMAVLGIRQLKAARSDMEAGWEPESAVHIRAALDATLDIAFLLSHGGEARWRLARKYHAMSLLRLKLIRREMEANASRFGAAKREEWEAANREFGAEKGTDPRDHWSGEPRHEVRTAGFGYLAKEMPDHIGDLKPFVKERIFDEIGSAAVHADPAAGAIFISRDPAGWLSIDPQPVVKWVHGVSLSTVGLMLLWVVARRADSHRREADRLLHRAHHLAEGLVWPPTATGETGEGGEDAQRDDEVGETAPGSTKDRRYES